MRRALAAASFAAAVWANFALASDELPLQLEVFINGAASNLIGSFTEFADGSLGATSAELQELGVKIPMKPLADGLVHLDAVSGLSYRYDSAEQRVDLTVTAFSDVPQIFDASGARNRSIHPASGSGLVLNYDLVASGLDYGRPLSLDGLSLALAGRVFLPAGTLSVNGIVREFAGAGTGFLPLDMTYATSDPENLVTTRLGDVVSGGLAWTRPLRLVGVQYARNFGLRPSLISQPLPFVTGTAVLPSTVDVYLDNARAYSQSVGAGPYLISDIPIVSAGGNATVVIRDAAGREIQSSLPLNDTTRLLRRGLCDYSFETGVARRDVGSDAFNIDDRPALSATDRCGLSDALTLEGHGEATGGLLNAGIGLSAALPRFSNFSLAAAGSLEASDWGLQLYARYETHFAGFDLRASSQRTFGRYADLGAVTARPVLSDGIYPFPGFAAALPPVVLDQVTLGLPPWKDHSRFAVSLVHLESEFPEQKSELVAASYSREIGWQSSLFATAFVDFGSDSNTGFYIGFTRPLGGDVTASATLTKSDGGVGFGVDASRPQGREPGSYGWQVRVTEGDGAQQYVGGSYRAPHYEARARIAEVDGKLGADGEISGAVVATPSGMFLSNRIDDAFAVVDVGVPGVGVTVENRMVATSDGNGKALVPELRSYQAANIGIDTSTLPSDVEIAEQSANILPGDRNGVDVKLSARSSRRSALLVLRDVEGKFIPVGARAHILGSDAELIVGYEGEAYVASAAAENELVVDIGSQYCRARFSFSESAEMQQRIDPVVCQ